MTMTTSDASPGAAPAARAADAAATLRSLADAQPLPFWLDDPGHRPQPRPALTGREECDLLVIGGGYSGLWTALLAKERDPARDVVLVEAHEIGWAASGRNGGFCAASLTHGFANGLARWPDEIAALEHLGHRNLDAIEETVTRHGIDCDFERTGEIVVATEWYQLAELRRTAEAAGRLGLAEGVSVLEHEDVRAQVDSPTFLGGLWDRHGVAMVNPARLAWGLARACEEAGVRVYEHTPASALTTADGTDGTSAGTAVRTPYGRVSARQVALGTNAFPSLVRRVRPYVVPVYDYALMTEPLSEAQLASVGWANRQGLSDSTNRFHYFRITADHRILWGGYDVLYHYGSRIAPELDQRPETFARLAEHFFRCFPQLEGLRFTHCWGGVIDTCSRFAPFFGTARGGRVGYAAGFTGLGVGATRFGAQVVLDLLSGERTERTALKLVRRKPLPFPPEPLRWAGIGLTQWSLARADTRSGRRNLWLRALDKAGLGFDS